MSFFSPSKKIETIILFVYKIFFTHIGNYWFTTTSKGKPRLVCNGFGYTKHGGLKSNDFHLWRCDHEKKSSCRARAKLTEKGHISFKGLHNHQPPPLHYYKALASHPISPEQPPSVLSNLNNLTPDFV